LFELLLFGFEFGDFRNPAVTCCFGPRGRGRGSRVRSTLATRNPWAITEHAALQRISPTRIDVSELDQAAAGPQPSTAEVRARARAAGLPVPDRGRLHPDIWQAWHDANDAN